MNQPIRHHYLPKFAYLRFFQSIEKPKFVWMYQRDKEPIQVNIDHVAKEKNLYSIQVDGGLNTDLETAFAEMEGIAGKIIEKLNKAEGPIEITTQEKTELSYFLAMQMTRTPAYRHTLKNQYAEMAKLHMQMLASNKEALAHALREIKKTHLEHKDLSVEEMQEFILNESGYTVEVGNENYFLRQMLQLGDHIYPTIMMKDIYILRSSNVELITCDYPLNLVPRPSIPAFYQGGFLLSDILIPISSNTALFLRNPDVRKGPPEPDDKILIGYKEITPVYGRWINKVSINHAERFLFSGTKNEKIKKLFDNTTVPKRFHMSSPFSKRENKIE